MAKGQKRPNKEVRKPKAEEYKPVRGAKKSLSPIVNLKDPR